MATDRCSSRRSRRIGRACLYGALLALAAFYLMPLWVMIVTSLKSLDEVYSGLFIGLPEVKVGLLPGGGGPHRLPRLIGVTQALPYLLEGGNISAAEYVVITKLANQENQSLD